MEMNEALRHEQEGLQADKAGENLHAVIHEEKQVQKVQQRLQCAGTERDHFKGESPEMLAQAKKTVAGSSTHEG